MEHDPFRSRWVTAFILLVAIPCLAALVLLLLIAGREMSLAEFVALLIVFGVLAIGQLWQAGRRRRALPALLARQAAYRRHKAELTAAEKRLHELYGEDDHRS